MVLPIGKATGALFVTLATEQLSKATGLPNTNPVRVQPTFVVVLIAIGATIVGNVVSWIVTTWVAVALFPEPSTTVHVTVVFPNGKDDGALFVTLATEQLSAVTGVPKATFTAKQPLFVEAVTAAGAVIVGTILSVTVTTWVAVAVFPEPSTTVHVTVVLPNGKATGALLVTLATAQLSVVTGAPKAKPVRVQPALVVVVIAAGAIIVGKVVSITVTVAVLVPILP